MKNEALWQSSKYQLVNQRWQASKDVRHVAKGSRLNVTLLAEFLSVGVAAHCRGRLLDLGCGAVPLYGMYRPRVNEITCIDWESSPHSLSHIDQACDLNADLQLESSHFDTVVMSDVLEHIYRPVPLLKEVKRVLADRGKVLISVPFMYWLHEVPHDYHRYTEHALRRMIEDAGLHILELRPIGGGLDVAADVVGKLLCGLPAQAFGLGVMIQRIAYWIGRTGVGARIRARTAAFMPLGYFVVAQKI